MEPRYIPLRTDGSKAPAISGWNSPDYHCSKDEALAQSPWIGLRADDLIIVDCDTTDAVEHWVNHVGGDPLATRTPRGAHFFYEAGPGSPSGPAVGVLPHTDIRAGAGSYVVCPPSPGYAECSGELRPFDPSWVPSFTRDVPPGGQGTSSLGPPGGWDVIPDGERNMRLTAILGGVQRQGISPKKLGALALGLNKALCVPPLPDEEVGIIVRSVARYKAEPDQAFVIDDDIAAPDQELWLDASTFGPPPPKTWLWYPFIPDTNLTVASGREGIGKGMFCAFLAAAVAMGVDPETGEACEPRPVAWLTAEDDPHDDVWPRLRAAGWNPDEHEEVRFLNQRIVMKLPEDAPGFERAVLQHNPGLVIMDPGRAYFGRHDGVQISFNSEADVRPALVELQQIAKRNRLPIVFVAHWRKGDGNTRDMTSGSGAWKQVARHAIDFAESADESEKAFWVGKTNIDRKGHVTGYHMVPVDEYETAKFVLDGPLPFNTLDEWIEQAKQARVVIDEMDVLLVHLEPLTPGLATPSKETLRQLSGLSASKITTLLAELARQGRIEVRQGVRSIWRG